MKLLARNENLLSKEMKMEYKAGPGVAVSMRAQPVPWKRHINYDSIKAVKAQRERADYEATAYEKATVASSPWSANYCNARKRVLSAHQYIERNKMINEAELERNEKKWSIENVKLKLKTRDSTRKVINIVPLILRKAGVMKNSRNETLVESGGDWREEYY